MASSFLFLSFLFGFRSQTFLLLFSFWDTNVRAVHDEKSSIFEPCYTNNGFTNFLINVNRWHKMLTSFQMLQPFSAWCYHSMIIITTRWNVRNWTVFFCFVFLFSHFHFLFQILILLPRIPISIKLNKAFSATTGMDPTGYTHTFLSYYSFASISKIKYFWTYNVVHCSSYYRLFGDWKLSA